MIKLQDVSKVYELDKDVVYTALKGINLTIKNAEFTAIMGPSGSGKSTLMHIIGLLDKPSKGKVLVEGKDISKLDDDEISTLRSEFVGFVFQQFNLINNLTVLENIMLPAIYAKRKLDYSPYDKAIDLLKKFGIIDRQNFLPNKISGGQQQRVAIARALIMNPKIVLADEPTGNLDSKTGGEILNLLKELNHELGVTIIIVTHEKNVAERTKRHVFIRDGVIVKKYL